MLSRSCCSVSSRWPALDARMTSIHRAITSSRWRARNPAIVSTPTTPASSLLDPVARLHLVHDLGVLDLPRRGALFEVLDPLADFLVELLVDRHVLLEDVAQLAPQRRVVG